jgi:hypothetical protein
VMSDIWVIEQGDYSDYRVVGVYDSKEKAQTVSDAINKGEPFSPASVSKWTMNPGFEEINSGMQMFICWMLKDGTVERCDAMEISAYQIHGECNIWKRSSAPFYKNKGLEDCLSAYVWATDEKHAIKIVNEKRLQMLALNRWK